MRAGKLYGIFLLTAVALGQACGARERGEQRESVHSGRDSSNAGGQAPDNRGGTGSNSKDYTAPDGAFSIKLPPGWRVGREPSDDAYVTTFTSDEYRAANLSIMTGNAAPACLFR